MTRKELVLVSCDQRWRRLPVRRVEWLKETPRRVNGNGSPCIQRGYRAGLPAPNAGMTFPADPLTPDEVLALMAACRTTTSSGRQHPHWRSAIRNRALIALLWRSGLRISEALDLLPHHVDPRNKTVTVMCGKGSKRRTVGIDAGALVHVSEWTWLRHTLGCTDRQPLFCSVLPPHTGGPVGSAYIRELLHELGRKAGIPKRVHPHGLRHTLAVELAREGVGVHVIQRQLGHHNLGTTATYLSGISAHEVVDVIAAREWPGGSR
jgi:site-specific recombinase XerD